MMLPRARRLCHKHQLRDPFAGLLRLSLGRHAPQHRVESAIGRNERIAATDCLVRLSEECRVWQPEIPVPEAKTVSEPQRGKQSLLQRLVNYITSTELPVIQQRRSLSTFMTERPCLKRKKCKRQARRPRL